MKHNRWTAIKLAAAGFACLALMCGCKNNSQGGAPPPPEVAVVTVASQKAVLTTELPGRTAPYRIAEVRPQVGGIIQKRLFTEGSYVEEGQPLFQIDPALYANALENAKAGLARSEAQLSTIELKAMRLGELLAEKAVSQQDYDDASAALKQTQADIQFARATLETAKLNLKYTTIAAPISGRIGRSTITEGALVTAQQPVALATIQQINPMYVDVSQSTAEVLRLQRLLADGRLDQNGSNQQKVQLLLDDDTTYPLSGTLKFRDVSVDPTTGSVILRIVFPNPKGLLLPGMFVRALVREGVNRQAILIPQQAVSRDPKGNPMALLVNAEGLVQPRPLVLDRAMGTNWLVSSGLAEGERVIVEGMLRVRPGMTVRAVAFGKKDAAAAAAPQNTAKPAPTN